jgi:tRNA (guanine37-N1)-methyltransferase
MIHFDILTLFPAMFDSALRESILKRTQERGLLSVTLHDIRDHAADKHHVTDDTPYGGGGGMVMKPEPIFAAVEQILGDGEAPPIVLLTPQGRLFDHSVARELSSHRQVVLICGRYEGVDERVRQHLATDELSIGDYVLSGGELAAMVIVDAVARLLPGALGDPGASCDDSHARGILEGPQYTRPAVFRDWAVPEVLLSGDHAAVARWRRQEALRRTLERRPELVDGAELTAQDRQFLSRLQRQEGRAQD